MHFVYMSCLETGQASSSASSGASSSAETKKDTSKKQKGMIKMIRKDKDSDSDDEFVEKDIMDIESKMMDLSPKRKKKNSHAAPLSFNSGGDVEGRGLSSL